MLRQISKGAQWRHHATCTNHFQFTSRPPSLRCRFSIITARFIERGDSKDKIRFFEQDTLKSQHRVEVDLKAEGHAEQEEMRGRLESLDRELEILRQGPSDPNSPFMKQLSEKDRAIALQALREYEANEGRDDKPTGLEEVFDKELDDMLREEFEGLAKEEEDDWDPTKPIIESTNLTNKNTPERIADGATTHPYVDRFNESLLKVVKNSSKITRQELWRWYRRCKQTIPSFHLSIPHKSTQVLWTSQFQNEIPSSSRISHLQILIDDMRSVGRYPSTTEMLMYIEALYDGGETEKALDLWETQQSDFSEGNGDLDAYWKLGVQLFAAHGDPQRAQDIAFAFLLSNTFPHPRILIPVIIAWARESGQDSANNAWALYLQLKMILGPEMTMNDYDLISIGLLNAGKVNLALAAFKDMMVTGTDPSKDSTALFKAALGRAGNLQASSINVQDVNKISLSTLTILPRRFQNKFFYASWMKKLIGMGEVDSAAAVAELMYERGVQPDAKHLNGIIGGWLRQGNIISRNKAERLGWAMVQHRIDLVWTRQYPNASPDTTPKPSVPVAWDGIRIPKFLQRSLPQANIETFSILLLHYTRRGDDGMVKYLTKCLGDAQIRPNSYFMNHLLYAELRRHDILALWQKYKAISSYVKPDLETFACLWDCGKLQYDRSRRAFNANFPSARLLFSEMMQWYSNLTARGKKGAQEEFSKDLYDQIIRCFCLSKDLPGTLVAIHAMRDLFGLFPDDNTARMLVLQIARMAEVPPGTPKHRLRRLSTSPGSKENIKQVNRLLELLSDRKASILESQGMAVNQLDPDERKQYQLEIMNDLLVTVLERTTVSPEQVEDQITTAAEKMSATGINLGSHARGISV